MYVLRSVSGFQTFPPGQKEAIISMLDGNNTIVLIPTGGGKQLPSLFILMMRPGRLYMARSKTRSSRKPRRISFPRFSTPSFPFCTIPKTENSELKTLEICTEVVSSNSEVLWSNSEVFQLRLFHFALRSKWKTSGFLQRRLIKLQGFPSSSFPF